jgi:dihydrofolate synthase/folylpolyglutamate synthase
MQGRQQARIGEEEFSLGLIGPHQVQNAACAVAALRQLPATEKISAAVLADGLERTVWSGRFEILSESPLIVLDGAHNPAGMRRLVETWRAFLASRGHVGERAHVVFASVSDKDITDMAGLLRPIAGEVSLARLANERTFEPAQMAPFFAGQNPLFYDSVAELWRGLSSSGPAKLPTLLTGSLFLVGEVLAQRQGNTEEYRLNERLGTALTR